MIESALWGMVGTFIGAAASIATTWISTNNAQLLHEKKWKDERQTAMQDFQRETLIDIQESLHDLFRRIYQAYIEDCTALRSGVAWGKNEISPDLDQDILLLTRKVSILTERISDDELRALIKTFVMVARSVLQTESKKDSDSLLADMSQQFEQCVVQIGTVLRRNY